MELTIENPDIDNVDEVLNGYINQYNKQYDHYFFKCHYKIVFNDIQYSTWSRCNLFNNRKAMISWKKYLENVIDDFKNNGYKFNHIEEKYNIKISDKMDMLYDSYIKPKMHAIEGKTNATINKNKNLINIIPETWRRLLTRKVRFILI